MSELQSASDPLWTRWSPFGFTGAPNGPKTGPPSDLFKRSPLDPPRTTMKSAADFEVHFKMKVRTRHV